MNMEKKLTSAVSAALAIGFAATASAATIWIVGALGFAVAFDQWWVALALSVLNWMTLYFLTPVKDDEQRE